LLARLARFCAYQERSHKEVRYKLVEEGARGDELEEIIVQLIAQGYLNEERFARAFAGGKFRTKKWGRIKIENELEANGLTPRCIRQGLSEIDDRDYRVTLEKLLQRKWNLTDESNLFSKKNKVGRFLIGKGYEPELVWGMLKEKGEKR
jgi:regulatory protein